MSHKTDLELVESVKQDNNSEAFTEICRRYENIFYKICHKYFNALQKNGVDPKDIFDEKNAIIYHCVKTFRVDKKSKLSTWIGNYARYLCLNSINARRFIIPISKDEFNKNLEDTQSFHDYSVHSKNFSEDYSYIVNILSQLKDPRINDIFKYRYLSGKKMIWAKVAKKMKISTQTAINLHNRGISLVKSKLKSQNISDIV